LTGKEKICYKAVIHNGGASDEEEASIIFFLFSFWAPVTSHPKNWGKLAMGVLTYGLFICNEDEERGTEISGKIQEGLMDIL
jgi:hypothetical protein